MKYPRPLSTTGVVPASAQEVPASASTGGVVDVGAGAGVVEVGAGLEVDAGGGVSPPAGAGPPPVRFPSPGGSGEDAPEEHAASSETPRRRTAPEDASKCDLAMFRRCNATPAPGVDRSGRSAIPDQVNVISSRIVRGQ